MLLRLQQGVVKSRAAALWRRLLELRAEPAAPPAQAEPPSVISTYRAAISRRPVSITEYRNQRNLARWRERYSEVEQAAARRPHKPKVAGATPALATNATALRPVFPAGLSHPASSDGRGA